MKGILKIGFNSVCITPKTCHLAGYAVKRLATGVHDDLYARVMVLADEKTSTATAWVALDLVGVDHLLREAVQAHINDLPITDIAMFASHTHASCTGVLDTKTSNLSTMQDFFGIQDEALIATMATKIADAIRLSYQDLDEMEISVHCGTVQNFSASRHEPDAPIDNRLVVCQLTRKDGRRCLVYHLGCHPTILHEDNHLVSADFVGVVDRYFKDKVDMTFFINGACADISTRFTRRDSSLGELERLGTVLASEIERVLATQGEQISLTRYSQQVLPLTLLKKERESVSELEAKVQEVEAQLKELGEGAPQGERRVLESYLEGYKGRIAALQKDNGRLDDQINAEVIRINGYTLALIPGELSGALAAMLKVDAVFTLANGYHSYISEEKAYQENKYEAQVSYYRQGEAEKMMNAINEFVRGDG